MENQTTSLNSIKPDLSATQTQQTTQFDFQEIILNESVLIETTSAATSTDYSGVTGIFLLGCTFILIFEIIYRVFKHNKKKKE